MNHKQVHIRCLLLSSENAHALIPAAIVAEIVAFVSPRLIHGVPGWFLGEITWREQAIPLVCLNQDNDSVSENTDDGEAEAKTIVLYGLQEQALLPFYGIRLARAPRPLMITPNDLTRTETIDPASSLSHASVKIGDIDAIIPNFAVLEQKILNVLFAEKPL